MGSGVRRGAHRHRPRRRVHRFGAALTGSGAQIAYVHQAPNAPDGVATISIVDVTVPINETGRVQQVAGMPPEAPGGAFKYRGARDPVISQNGRHLAFVSDTTASEALPGWGTGPVLGEFATSQVYVWDRQAQDQRRAVRLISGHDGVASAAGGAEPDMSEDGRVIVFTSGDRTLLPANLTHCIPDCPSQVYRFDRDTDGNGIFDEPRGARSWLWSRRSMPASCPSVCPRPATHRRGRRP